MLYEVLIFTSIIASNIINNVVDSHYYKSLIKYLFPIFYATFNLRTYLDVRCDMSMALKQWW